ncbi:MAG: hypothetical protein V7K41_11760 [Nostoc sp.]|uniref:hypothetical protein n=1 Tax=Nostoc sp. TaxID=1180 RepID=UPI002FF6767B
MRRLRVYQQKVVYFSGFAQSYQFQVASLTSAFFSVKMQDFPELAMARKRLIIEMGMGMCESLARN